MWKLAKFLATAVLADVHSITEEVDPHGGFSMIQRTAVSRTRPWDERRYIMANYHKSGVHLTGGIFFEIFSSLGISTSLLGNVVYPCSFVNTCFNPNAPVKHMTDSYNVSYGLEERQRYRQPVYAAVSVRDPLVMVASAYCYHHDGHEPLSKIIPEKEVRTMDFQAGTNFIADRMLPLIQTMASVAADQSTHVLSFERLTESSESFDQEVKDFLDFMFSKDLITEAERRKALEGARMYDARRNPSRAEAEHTNSKGCEKQALAATSQLEPEMLRTLQELRNKLGYTDHPMIK